jgi:murein DD-endopeptidase MepM/ murein hydrolase activator NlpD
VLAPSASLLLAALLSAPLELRLAPEAARPGDAVLVRVRGAAAEPSGTVAGRPLAFWKARGEWRALAALPMETPVGVLPVAVRAGETEASAELGIVEPAFPARHVSGVPGKFVEPPPEVTSRIEADRAASAAAYARGPSGPVFRGNFAWPRRARLTGRFGDQRVLNGDKRTVHYGTDVTGPRGAPIAAANDGVVVLARDAYLSGKTVVLAHGAGIYTAYFHLDRILVKEGAKVSRGARIGRLGSTGRSTGPHLHWSARVGGLFVDPESLLALDFRTGKAPRREPRSPEPAPPAPPPAEGTEVAPVSAGSAPPR